MTLDIRSVTSSVGPEFRVATHSGRCGGRGQRFDDSTPHLSLTEVRLWTESWIVPSGDGARQGGWLKG